MTQNLISKYERYKSQWIMIPEQARMALTRNLILVTVALGACLSQKIDVSWVTDNSMKLTIDDKNMRINLKAVEVPGEDVECLFSGKLEEDSSSSVTVSGCKDSDETSLTIRSPLIPDGFLSLGLSNGVTTHLNDGVQDGDHEHHKHNESVRKGFQM